MIRAISLIWLGVSVVIGVAGLLMPLLEQEVKAEHGTPTLAGSIHSSRSSRSGAMEAFHPPNVVLCDGSGFIRPICRLAIRRLTT